MPRSSAAAAMLTPMLFMPRELPAIRQQADQLLGSLAAVEAESDDTLGELRRNYLTRQIESLAARVEMLEGAEFEFDEESRAL